MSNIYYDLDNSPYTYELNNFKFYFSSKFYLEKFKDKLIGYIQIENERIKTKYKTNVECDYILYISLYKIIEKRGFLIKYENKLLNNYIIKNIIVLNND